MSTADALYTLVKAMPEEQASMVLRFAEFLQHQSQSSTTQQKLSLESNSSALTWSAEMRSLAGAWTDFPTVEEIRSGFGPNTPREPL